MKNGAHLYGDLKHNLFVVVVGKLTDNFIDLFCTLVDGVAVHGHLLGHYVDIKVAGGNQQKVIIGRWLLTEPEVLLLDEPTRGIDVGAKFEIYQLINDLAAKGKGVMVVSSEMPELIGICDRILVMSNGRVAGILDMKKDYHGQEQEEIMRLAAKYI